MQEDWDHWCAHCGHAIAPVDYGRGWVHYATERVACNRTRYDDMSESEYIMNGGTFAEPKGK